MSASADTPPATDLQPFTAPTCAGDTMYDPTANTGYAVNDLTQVFGERLTSYKAGHIVPLYDAFGGSVLLTDTGDNTGEAGYPPVCGVRYVASLQKAVSEWMFCTDREAQACGDTDAKGDLVDKDGNPINPLTTLTRNPRLSADQEAIIAHLIQKGHSYSGVGNQSWEDATEARSDAGSNERLALQTLVWCVSDPSTEPSNFTTTCENNMNAAEQARILAMTPPTPALTVTPVSAQSTLAVGATARFTLSTNVFHQPIQVVTDGTATSSWSVCGGDADLTGSTLTVDGDDPSASKDVTLCATATTAGTAALALSASPASLEHIGWSQSVNDQLSQPCQVYATFHEVKQEGVSGTASLIFTDSTTPGPTPTVTPTVDPTPTITPTVNPTPTANAGEGLAATGGTVNLLPVWLGLGLIVIGGGAVTASAVRSRHRS